MRGEATFAIVKARLRKDARIAFFFASTCGLLAYLQRNEDAAAQLAGCMVFVTLAGVATVLLQRGCGRLRQFELCEQSAPLYGRELARATALVPCITVTLALAEYWLVSSLYDRPDLAAVGLAAAATYAATLVAMCATVRLGFARIAYVTLACAVSSAAFLLTRWPIGISLVLCVIAGFIALRQYGEALARYDPAPV